MPAGPQHTAVLSVVCSMLLAAMLALVAAAAAADWCAKWQNYYSISQVLCLI